MNEGSATSNRAGARDGVKDRRRPGRSEPPMLPKAERRALGKLAAQKRKAAARRRRRVRQAGVVVAVLAVLGGVAWWAGLFDGEPPADPAASQATPTTAPTDPIQQLPPGVDPTLATKPSVGPGTAPLTELTTTTLVEGTGPVTQNGQQLTVNYVGVSYESGQEFDSSWSRNQPYPFKLGAGSVIPGWDQGLVGVKVGSRVQLDIPTALAYGANPQPGAPQGPLRFVVDVLAAT